jgi:hypothetical protein
MDVSFEIILILCLFVDKALLNRRLNRDDGGHFVIILR